MQFPTDTNSLIFMAVALILGFLFRGKVPWPPLPWPPAVPPTVPPATITDPPGNLSELQADVDILAKTFEEHDEQMRKLDARVSSLQAQVESTLRVLVSKPPQAL